MNSDGCLKRWGFSCKQKGVLKGFSLPSCFILILIAFLGVKGVFTSIMFHPDPDCLLGGKLNTNLNHQIAGSPETIFLFHQLPGNHYDIWVMKEYNVEESWTKLYSIHLDNGEEKCLISVRRNGKFISCGEGAGHSEFYSESLVLLGDDNCVTHLQQEEECRGEERCTCLRINELNLRSIKRDINQREA